MDCNVAACEPLRHPFWGRERVSVTLTEQNGPDTIELCPISEYDDVPVTHIAWSQAVSLAHNELIKAIGQNMQISGKPNVRLVIVQPHYATVQKNGSDAIPSNRPKARLAWIVMYGLRRHHPDADGPGLVAAYVDTPAIIAIDAKDGSSLGVTTDGAFDLCEFLLPSHPPKINIRRLVEHNFPIALMLTKNRL